MNPAAMALTKIICFVLFSSTFISCTNDGARDRSPRSEQPEPTLPDGIGSRDGSGDGAADEGRRGGSDRADRDRRRGGGGGGRPNTPPRTPPNTAVPVEDWAFEMPLALRRTGDLAITTDFALPQQSYRSRSVQQHFRFRSDSLQQFRLVYYKSKYSCRGQTPQVVFDLVQLSPHHRVIASNLGFMQTYPLEPGSEYALVARSYLENCQAYQVNALAWAGAPSEGTPSRVRSCQLRLGLLSHTLEMPLTYPGVAYLHGFFGRETYLGERHLCGYDVPSSGGVQCDALMNDAGFACRMTGDPRNYSYAVLMSDDQSSGRVQCGSDEGSIVDADLRNCEIRLLQLSLPIRTEMGSLHSD